MFQYHSTPLRVSATTLLMAAFLTVTGLAPASAQDVEAPAAQEPAPAEAPAAKPKPRPKPKPKPKPAEAETKPSETKPDEAKPAETKAGQDGTLLEPAAADGPSPWPNGARSVSESYGDWTMNCTREGATTDCVVIQSQGDRRTGRRQFSIELRVPKDGRAEGLILMPFGLQIESGVTFKLDDRSLGKGAPYSYCIADGCLVPISLPTVATDAMKTAQSLTVSATKPDAKEPTVISAPLSGFAAAFARSIALGD